MGDEQARKTATQRLIERQPKCVYCGGDSPSEERDHAPPITVFDLRDRPAGLEFGACKECHESTRTMDLIVSVVSRMYPVRNDEAHREELRRLIRQFGARFPYLAQEFKDHRPVHKDGKIIGYAINVKEGHITKVLEAFAARMGLCLYREISGAILPRKGGVGVRWFSNADAMDGKLPSEFLALVGDPKTLRAGEKHVSDQFTYRHVSSEDHSVVAMFVAFRASFAFAAFVATDATCLGSYPEKVFRPGFLKSWKAPTGVGPALQKLHKAVRAAGLNLRTG